MYFYDTPGPHGTCACLTRGSDCAVSLRSPIEMQFLNKPLLSYCPFGKCCHAGKEDKYETAFEQMVFLFPPKAPQLLLVGSKPL